MNFLIAQSGGPTTAINASLSGVIQGCLEHSKDNKVYGAINGIEGVLNKNIIDLHSKFTEEKSLEQLKYTPAMFLGSCRYKLDTSYESKDYDTIFKTFEEYSIDCFFYIGGNDSMDTVNKLSGYAKEIQSDVRIIGIPKTIDNDLVATDHTPGFGSAAKFVSSTILDIAHDTYIYNCNSVTIVEIMGRNAGWLTAATALARNSYNGSPDLIYLPEVPFETYQFLSSIKELMKRKKNIIVAVSEGIKDANGNYICASQTSTARDGFGHAKLTGTAKVLESMVQTALNCKVRSIELNVLQRSSMQVASKTDLDEAALLGSTAVTTALEGTTGVMMAVKRQSNAPYTVDIVTVPVSDVANKEKTVPLEWITPAGNDVTDECINYLKPLIQGEPQLIYEDGLPSYLDISHLIA